MTIVTMQMISITKKAYMPWFVGIPWFERSESKGVSKNIFGEIHVIDPDEDGLSIQIKKKKREREN